MSRKDIEKLKEEMEMLRALLDFHVEHRTFISMGGEELEEYVDAVLDRLK